MHRSLTEADSAEEPAEDPVRPLDYVWGVARIAAGSLFLWAYVDRAFGLVTPVHQAWMYGGSPTSAFRHGGLPAPAGQPWVDGLFMFGLLGFGLCLVLGVATRAVATAGGITLALMWAAALPLSGRPFAHEYIVYAVGLALLAVVRAGDTLGLGRLVTRPYLK
ncbi:hypothetical protein [Nonomuraea sp. NPDC003727]